MTEVTTEADAADDVPQVSMDAKATVKVGPFAGGDEPDRSAGGRP